MTLPSVLRLAPLLCTVVIAAHARAQAPLFEGVDVFTPPQAFRDAVRGDFDGDGDARDVVGLTQSYDVVAFPSTGDASWGTPIVTDTTQLASVSDIEAADLDGDGDLDLVAANANVFTNSVTVLRNTGSGSFTSHVSYPVGASATNLALRDFDLDGDVDVVTAVQPSGGGPISQFKLLRNQGNGTFAPAESAPVGPTPRAILAIDADLDGDMDLALAETSTSTVRIHTNAGDGTFPTSSAYAAGAAVTTLRALDVDGDGDLDLAAGSSTGISVLQRAADGTFPSFTTYPTAPLGPIATFDAEGDGDDDLVVQITTNRFAVVTVAGGVLLPPVEHPGRAPNGFVPHDYDADGDEDLVLIGGLTSLVRNSGDGRFFDAPSQPVGNEPRSLRLADLDGDGHLDAANANRDDGTATILWGAGDGTWAASDTIALGSRVFLVRIADLDGDGDLDLAVAGDDSGLFVLLNLGGRTFAPASSYPHASDVSDLQLSDMDGDGDLDALLARYDIHPVPSISRFDNAGNGVFAAPVTIASVSFVEKLAVGDLDGDGIKDLVLVRWGEDFLALMFGRSGGTFGPVVPIFMGGSSTWVELLDLDGDGDLDVGVRGTFGWRALSNDGSGSLSNGVLLPTAGFSFSYTDPGVVFEDLDGDGDLDFAAGTIGALVTALGHGDATFDPPRFVGVLRTEMRSMALGDLDRDGDLDVAYTATDGTVNVLRGSQVSALSTCAGDGSAAPCPCGNESAAGSATGCANSFGPGGALRASGYALLTDDRLRLDATQLPPTASALYFQGTALVAGGQGASFGDGLRCAGGAVLRLGTKVSSGGASNYPTTGDQGVAARGAITTPGTRFYQVWYRNSAAYCTVSTFNLTNASVVTWNL